MKLVSLFQYVFSGKGIIDLGNIDPNDLERRKLRTEKRSKEIRKEFEFILIDERLSSSFRAMLLHLNNSNSLSLEKILFETKEMQVVSSPENFVIPTDDKLQGVFKEINSLYGYFVPDDLKAFEQFSVVYKFLQLASNYINCDNSAQLELYECAYKTLVCLGSFKDPTELKMLERIEQYFLSKQASSLANKSIPSIMDLQIGKKDGIHFEEWTQFIQKYGVKSLIFFKRAQDIEQILRRVPQTSAEAFDALAQVDYKRYREDPELAKVCEQYTVPEAVFNRCLDLEVKKLWKTKDNLPNVVVNGSDPEIGQSAYYLVKLPIGDPRALILGYITNDCQSIGSKGETCVLDGISSEHDGFYVMLKKKESQKNVSPFLQDNTIDYDHFEIVGQGYAWISMSGNLTIDSWENARQKDDEIAVAMLGKFSQMVISESKGSIVRVTTGKNSPRTPSAFRNASSVKYDEIMEEGTQYSDSTSQTPIAVDFEQIRNIQEDLLFELTDNAGFVNTETLQNLIEPIYSQKHSMWILSLLRDSNSLDWHSEKILSTIRSCVVEDNTGGLITWKALFLLETASPSLLDNSSFQQITANRWQARHISLAIIALGNGHLLDRKNLEVIFNISNSPMLDKNNVLANVSSSIIRLSRANIHLDHHGFEALAKACFQASPAEIEDILTTVITLKNKFDITLDGATFEKLLDNGKHAPDVRKMFLLAKECRMNLLDNAVYKNIIVNAPYLKPINERIPKLATLNILDNTTFQSLIKNAKDYPYLPDVILLLSNEDILDKENFDQLMQYAPFAEDIYDALNPLDDRGMLDREKVQFIFEQRENAQYWGKIFEKLDRVDLLDNVNFNKLKSCLANLEEVSKIISLFEEYDLLDKDSFLFVVDNHSSATFIIKSLKKLKGDDALDDRHLKELMKNISENTVTSQKEDRVFPSESAKEKLQRLKNPEETESLSTDFKVS